MAKSLQATVGVCSAPHLAPCRTHDFRNGVAADGRSHRRRWRVAGHLRSGVVCVSSAQEDEIDNEEVIADVETLLGEEELEAEPEMTEETGIEATPAQGESESKNAPQYALNFLWLDRNVAVAVDQLFPQAPQGSRTAPLTEYFFWPRNDAWEELKNCLETKMWISDREKVLLLNRTTEVINFWQDEESKHTIEDAKKEFPDCSFFGA